MTIQQQTTVRRMQAAAAAGLCLAVILVPGATSVAGQPLGRTLEPEVTERSHARAAALSLLLPGLGQHYVNGGSWKGTATLFALADVASWVGLARTVGARSHRIDSYTALAAARADADVEGKGRSFFLNLATYRSSDEFLEAQLRNRAWDELDDAAARDFQWEWASEEDFVRFRDLRNDAESLDRRASILIATLVANRLVSAIVAIRAARRADESPGTTLSFSPPLRGMNLPRVHLRFRL